MATLKLSGTFGDLVLTLVKNTEESLVISAVQTIGQEVLTGAAHVSFEGVIINSEDMERLLGSVRLYNSLKSGLGRVWSIEISGNYETLTPHDDSGDPESQEQVTEHVVMQGIIEMVPARPMVYSRCGVENDNVLPWEYSGTLQHETISRRTCEKASAFGDSDSDITNVQRSHVDLVSYLHERNALTASDYDTQVDCES